MTRTSYAIALGSNQRTKWGSPCATVRAAMDEIGGVSASGPIIETPPIGPSRRRFANSVIRIETDEMPDVLLRRLKAIERKFGRRRGQRWGARPIDLDLIWWSGGSFAAPGLIVPHIAFRTRRFVLDPMAAILPMVRDPITGLTIRQLAYRARVDPSANRP